MNIFILMIILNIVPPVALFLVDRTITNKRIDENQKAWNEYSKCMTFNEKMECYLEWCERRKAEKNWEHYYFPRM